MLSKNQTQLAQPLGYEVSVSRPARGTDGLTSKIHMSTKAREAVRSLFDVTSRSGWYGLSSQGTAVRGVSVPMTCPN